MGSVLAASSPSPALVPGGAGQGGPGLVTVPPGFSMPPVTPSSASGQLTEETDPPLPNPGTYEECHRKCKGVNHQTVCHSYANC